MLLTGTVPRKRFRRGQFYLFAFGLIGFSLLVPIDRLLYMALLPISESPFGTLWAHCADILGNGITLMLLSAGLCFYFPGARGFGRATCIFNCLKALLLAGFLGQVMKFVVGRPRPGIGLESWALNSFSLQNDFHSFPSGHAAGALAVALVLSKYLPRYRAFFFSFAIFVSLGRLVGQSHFLSDIAAGFVIAFFAADLVTGRSALLGERLRPGC